MTESARKTGENNEFPGCWVADGFDASTDVATTFFDLSGGIDIFAQEHAVLRAGAFTSLSDVDTIYGGSLRLEIPF